MKQLLLMCLLLFSFFGCTQQKRVHLSGKVVKIGVLAPLSRENKRYGYQSLLGLEFANKHKTVLANGDEIVLEIVDTNSSSQGTQKALQSLLDKNVTAIISFVGSGNMLALKNMLHKTDTPMIVTLATNDEITTLNDSISQICMSNQREALVAAHYIKDEKFINNVGILYYKENPYSFALTRQFRDYYTKIHGKELFCLDFSRRNALQKLQSKDLKNVKMIFSVLNAKESVKVLKILQNSDTKLLFSDGALSSAKEMLKDDLHYFEGSYIIEHYAHDMRGTKDYKSLQCFLSNKNLQDSSYAFLAYDAYALLYYTLQNCSGYKRECINALFQNSDIIEGIAGNFSMENAKAKRKIYIDKIENLRLKREIVTY